MRIPYFKKFYPFRFRAIGLDSKYLFNSNSEIRDNNYKGKSQINMQMYQNKRQVRSQNLRQSNSRVAEATRTIRENLDHTN